MHRYLFLAFLSVWVALPIAAQTSVDAFSDGETPASTATAKTTGLSVGQGGKLFFDFDSGFTAGSESLPFFIAADKAKVCLDPDRNGTAGAAVVDVQVCPTSDAASDNTCTDTGLILSASNPCESFARGRYRFEVTTAATGTQDAQITVEAY